MYRMRLRSKPAVPIAAASRRGNLQEASLQCVRSVFRLAHIQLMMDDADEGANHDEKSEQGSEEESVAPGGSGESAYTRKNCDPSVSLPALAIATVPAGYFSEPDTSSANR